MTNKSNLESQTSVLDFYRRVGFELKPIGNLEFDERIDAWDLSRDNRLLALAAYPTGTLRVIELSTGADLFQIPGPRYAGDVAFSPGGRFVAAGGDGLLVVDLLNANRRAYYSYLYNNIGHVRFSPSGDALAASAYDGRVRVFELKEVPAEGLGASTTEIAETGTRLQLSLLKELRHAGQANVYDFVFEADGGGLVSASGDQTIRWFRGSDHRDPKLKRHQATHFRSLSQWQSALPAAAPPLSSPEAQTAKHGHPVPAALSGAGQPARIKPGSYACKITSLYRLRDCTVHQDAAGHTRLVFHTGNLLSLEGVLFDDGPILRFEGWLTEPTTLIDCAGCERQLIHGVLRGNGRNFKGVLTFRNYFDPQLPPAPPPANVKIEEALDRYPIVLQFRSAAQAPGSKQGPVPQRPHSP